MGVSVDDEAGAEATAPNPTSPPRLLGPAGWSVTEVGRWLGEIGYKQYAPAFRTHQISGEVLPLLSKDVLGSELGVQSLGHRLLILQAIRQLFPDLPTAPGGGGQLKLDDVARQAGKAAEVVVSGHAEVRRLAEKVEALQKSLQESEVSLAELRRTAAKPEPTNLSAESQARINKALKQTSDVAIEVQGLRDEMKTVYASLAKSLKEGLGRLDILEKTSGMSGSIVPPMPTAAVADKTEKAAVAGKGKDTTKKAGGKAAAKPEAPPKAPAKASESHKGKVDATKVVKPANQAALGAGAGAEVATAAANGKGAKGGRGARGGRGRGMGRGSKMAEAPTLQLVPVGPSSIAVVLDGGAMAKDSKPANHATAVAPALVEAKLGVRSACEVQLSIELY